MDKPTIDFSVYSDADLESALITINRFDYEVNYQACLAEVNKRKSEENWSPVTSKSNISGWGAAAAVAEVVVGIREIIGSYS